MTVINPRVPSWVTRGGRLPALQTNFDRLYMPSIKPFHPYFRFFRAGSRTPWDLPELIEIVDNRSRTTCRCTLTVQIGSKLRGNFEVTVGQLLQPGFACLESPICSAFFPARSCAIALKMSSLGGKPRLPIFCAHFSNSFSPAVDRVCSSSRALCHDFLPLLQPFSVDRRTPNSDAKSWKDVTSRSLFSRAHRIFLRQQRISLAEFWLEAWLSR